MSEQLQRLGWVVTFMSGIVSSSAPIFMAPTAWAIELESEQLDRVASAAEQSSQTTDDLFLSLPTSIAASQLGPLERSMIPVADQTTDQTTDQPMELAQTSEPVQVVGVQVNATDAGLEVILETAAGQLNTPSTSIVGNALIADIPNAVLALPEGDDFQAANPIVGIALVTVTARADGIRVAITGTEAPPTADVQTAAQGLILSVATGSIGDAEGDEEAIQVVVTGEQETGYAVPRATTATRTETPLLDVPQSIQVIPEQVLEDQQVTRLDEALRNVSGVSFGGVSAGRNLIFRIRGFDNATVLRDGFRQYSGLGFPEVANLEQIEVLQGPASILYGEIQPGGVVNLVTEQPLSQPFYELEAQVGNRGFLRPTIDLSGPLTPDGVVLYRLNAVYARDDGFRDFDQDIERFFISPLLTFQLGDRTDLTLELQYLDEERPSDYGLPAFEDGIVDVPFDRITGEPDDVLEEEFVSAGYTLEHQFSDNWTLRNAFRYIGQDLVSDIAFTSDFNENTGIVTRNWAYQTSEEDTYSVQTNLIGEFTTGSIGHTLLVGLDLSRSLEDEQTRFDFENELPLNIFDPNYGEFARPDSDTLPILINTETEADRLGIYIQDQIQLLNNLILLAGVRYDTVEQRVLNLPTAFEANASDATQTDDAFSPRVGIVYQPLENLSLYASYSQSFVPNSSTTASGDFLEPERGEGFEIGVKAELFDDRLLATLAYYDITKQNIATADPDVLGASIATGEQRSRGIGLDIAGEILPGWNVIAAYAFTDAEVTEDNIIPEGNRVQGVPEHSASLWTTYEIQTGTLQGLGFGLGLYYVGDRAGDPENTFDLGDYFLTNAAIFYRRDNWRAALNIENLFDINYIAGASTSRVRGNDPGEPFRIVGSVSVEF